jgi:hypothetical protein
MSIHVDVRAKDVLFLQELEPYFMGLYKRSKDGIIPLTIYGRHLLQLDEYHDLLILNGHPYYPMSRGFICFPHNGGANAVDYVLANQDLLPYI